MKFLKLAIALCCIFFSIVTHAETKKTLQILTVPFQNFLLGVNGTIEATFDFGPHPFIFCFENNLQTVGIVTWPFKGVINRSTLPITLVTNGNFDGQFSDPTGTITVTNNTAITLVVSCIFPI